VPRDDKKEVVPRDDKKKGAPREDKKGSAPREDKKGKLGMREEGMLWSAGEISPLDKTEILDKTKNNEKIPLDKVERFGIKEK
jgi:hypothetical protein